MSGFAEHEAGAEAVGARIRVAREAAQMSRAQLASRIGVEEASLRAWESGEREPRANRLRMLSGLLGVSLAWLLEGRDDGSLAHTVMTVQALSQRLERARLLLSESSAVLEDIEASLAELDPHARVSEPVSES